MKKQNNKPITSFWNMKPVKVNNINRLKNNSKPSFSPKFIQPVNLKQYSSRTKQEIKLIDKNPWGDKDRDKVPNIFDCKPLNKNKQDKMTEKEILERMDIIREHLQQKNK